MDSASSSRLMRIKLEWTICIFAGCLDKRFGLEDAYLKLSEEDLLEGDSKHVGYVDVIDQLTIDESNKLRREVETLRVEKNSWLNFVKRLMV